MRVLCSLPNASSLINGVTFALSPHGLISEDLTPEVAQHFASIPGYRLHWDAPGDTLAPAPQSRPAVAVAPNPAPARRTRTRTPR